MTPSPETENGGLRSEKVTFTCPRSSPDSRASRGPAQGAPGAATRGFGYSWVPGTASVPHEREEGGQVTPVRGQAVSSSALPTPPLPGPHPRTFLSPWFPRSWLSKV